MSANSSGIYLLTRLEGPNAAEGELVSVHNNEWNQGCHVPESVHDRSEQMVSEKCFLRGQSNHARNRDFTQREIAVSSLLVVVQLKATKVSRNYKN